MQKTFQSPPITKGPFSVGPIRASDNAEFYLKSLIFSRQLAPSQKLPPERELAKQLGVAAATLRVALRSLESAGFVVITRGSTGGSTVADEKTLHQLWGEQARANRSQLRNLLEFAAMIEEDVARAAAERRTKGDMKNLETIAQSLVDDSTETRWHYHLHATLAKSTHNPYLERANAAVQAELFMPVAMLPGDIVELKAIHLPIVAAVRDRDPGQAALAMRAHAAFRETKYPL